MGDKIAGVLNFIREARDEADTVEEHILLFFTFLLIGVGTVFIASTFLMLAFTFPRVFLPICFTIFILWQGYKRL